MNVIFIEPAFPHYQREFVRALAALVDCAQGMPAARSASFIDGLSRHSQAVRTLVHGMPQRSRTRATGRMCASTVASSRSIQMRRCRLRTASSIAASSTTERTCS